MAWMSTTAKRVGTILLFAEPQQWIRWQRSIIQLRLTRGEGIILLSILIAMVSGLNWRRMLLVLQWA